MTSFSSAQAEYEARLPESDPTVTGTIEICILEGPHAEKMALLEYGENNLVGASDVATKEEIDIEEIHETDVSRGLDALIESKEYYNQN